MDYDEIRKLIKFDESGKGDITPLFRWHIFQQIIGDIYKSFLPSNLFIDKVAGLEARGFAFAAPVAHLLKSGLVLVRKGGKIPLNTVQMKCAPDYSGQEKCLEISRDAIGKGERVLIVDDWLETGNQLKTAISLIEQLGGIVVGIAMVIDDATIEARQLVSSYKYHYLIKMPKRTVG